ncbi:prepilin-type N-terminal cleavage/methylation domain-containing protein [Alteromonas sp. ASW11-19]|uniref:Prepilin-type N-terminal cleavage/methylation domain-containing protein n=1 Tax=Alteromonas salexigens TaxID=2982530 RepID=A0ABT2VQZ5_9ALTE|nr:prepilin-type N-terminal cleavage/methylation domain-containing protein [Alteromonas salexigens]MCU7555730.1 prepilin-type N-terminal cleavage/methylation domain-containing protein [Alteromonas salexigens]
MKRACKSSFLRNRGVTLPECLIVVAIIALLSIIAAPSLASWQHQQRVVTRMHAIAQVLRTGAQHAETSGKKVYLSVIGGSQWCLRLSFSAQCACLADPTCPFDGVPVLLQTDSAADVWVWPATQRSPLVVFAPHSGITPGFATSLKVQHGQYEGKVIYSALGRVRMCLTEPFRGLPAC